MVDVVAVGPLTADDWVSFVASSYEVCCGKWQWADLCWYRCANGSARVHDDVGQSCTNRTPFLEAVCTSGIYGHVA